MKTIWLALIVVMLLLVAVTGCDCGDDDDDDSGAAIDDDDTVDDDDSGDDDVVDDDDTDDDVVDDDDIVDDDDTDDDDAAPVCDYATHDPLIEAGKAFLNDGNHIEAYEQFYYALQVCEGSADARYGILLADSQWYIEWFQTWIDYISNFNPAPHKGDKSGSSGFFAGLQEVIRYQLLPVDEQMITMAGNLINDQSDTRFFVDPLPMWIDQEHVVVEMAGEWDVNDVRNIKAAAQMIDGLWRMVLAYDLEFNYYLFSSFSAPEGTLIEVIHGYAGLVLDILNDPLFPDFLTFLSGGEQDLSDGAVNLGQGLMGVQYAFRSMRDETDPQEDDVSGYVDANGNGQWDEGEFYKAPYFGDMPYEMNETFSDILAMMDNLGKAVLDRGPEDFHPYYPDWFSLQHLNWVLELGDLGVHEYRFPPVPLPVGRGFYYPDADGARPLVETIAQAIYDATAP